MFSYLSEFFLEKHRGPLIIILSSLWQPGIIYTGKEVGRERGREGGREREREGGREREIKL